VLAILCVLFLFLTLTFEVLFLYSAESAETVFVQTRFHFVLFVSSALLSYDIFSHVISFRAPLNVVQSDDWDCSCCLLWDPARADCAVPQVTLYLFCYSIIAKIS
jgi:hypothetical protein